jgi:hypothetical protein
MNPASPQPSVNYPVQGLWAVAHSEDSSRAVGNWDSFWGVQMSAAKIGEMNGGVLPVADNQTASGQKRALGEPFVIRPNLSYDSSGTTDWAVLFDVLTDPRVRNFYYNGHATSDAICDPSPSLAGLGTGLLKAALHNGQPGPENVRYRFVFLDGCDSAKSDWPGVFALGMVENKQLVDYKKARPGIFIGWDIEPGLFATPLNDNGRNAIGQWVRGSWRAEYVYFMADFLAQLQNFHKNIQDAYNHALNLMPSDLLGHLKMYGYWGLTVYDYNLREDWTK